MTTENEMKIEALHKLQGLIETALEAHDHEALEDSDNLNRDLQQISSAVNISHLLLRWTIDAWESDGDIPMEDGIKAIRIHVAATDTYAGVAKMEYAENLIKKILSLSKD